MSDNKTCRFWISSLHPELSVIPSRLLSSEHFLNSDLVLVSGTQSWIAAHLPVTCSTPILCALDFTTTSPPRTLYNMSWVKLVHASLGGVTDGWWFFGSSLPLADGSPMPVSYARPLRSVLSSTVTNVLPTQTPSDPDVTFSSVVFVNKALHCGGLLPVSRAASIRVCCPSVFTPSHWGIRPLTVSELSTAFDLPESFSAHFASTFAGPSSHLPFLRAAPSKLLRAFYSTFILPSSWNGFPGGCRASPMVAPEVLASPVVSPEFMLVSSPEATLNSSPEVSSMTNADAFFPRKILFCTYC